MGLFDMFTKKKNVEIGAPMTGELVDISMVSDSTFSTEILGTSVAVIPSDGKVYAPATGTISTLFPTLHAIAISTSEGAELLVHIGLDTVKLEGKHFTAHTEEGAKVKKGDLLMEVDLEAIKAEGFDVITPVIICNTDEMESIEKMPAGAVSAGNPVMKAAVK